VSTAIRGSANPQAHEQGRRSRSSPHVPVIFGSPVCAGIAYDGSGRVRPTPLPVGGGRLRSGSYRSAGRAARAGGVGWTPGMAAGGRCRTSFAVAGAGQAGRRSAAHTVRAGRGPGRGGWRARVFCCRLRVISVDGSATNLPDSVENAAFFGRPSTAARERAFRKCGGGGGGVRDWGPNRRSLRPISPASRPRLWTCCRPLAPGMVILADRNFLSHVLARAVLATDAHILWRAAASFARTPVRAARSYLAGRAQAGPQGRRPAGDRAGHRVHRAHHCGQRADGAADWGR
jgi:hypothetical protein